MHRRFLTLYASLGSRTLVLDINSDTITTEYQQGTKGGLNQLGGLGGWVVKTIHSQVVITISQYAHPFTVVFNPEWHTVDNIASTEGRITFYQKDSKLHVVLNKKTYYNNGIFFSGLNRLHHTFKASERKEVSLVSQVKGFPCLWVTRDGAITLRYVKAKSGSTDTNLLLSSLFRYSISGNYTYQDYQEAMHRLSHSVITYQTVHVYLKSLLSEIPALKPLLQLFTAYQRKYLILMVGSHVKTITCPITGKVYIDLKPNPVGVGLTLLRDNISRHGLTSTNLHQLEGTLQLVASALKEEEQLATL